MKMINSIRGISAFGDLVNLSTKFFILSMASATLLTPLLIKTQGVELATEIIALYLIANKVSPLFIVYLDLVPFNVWSKAIIVVQTLAILLPLTLLVSDVVFIHSALILSLCSGMVYGVWSVTYDSMISEGDMDRYKEIQVMESTTFAASGLLASGVAYVCYMGPLWLPVGISMVLGVASLVIAVRAVTWGEWEK